MNPRLEKWVTALEDLREHPILSSLRHGVMWSLVPVGVAMVPLYFLLGAQPDWNLRVMNVYLASLGLMGPCCALLISYFLSKSYKVRSFAGSAALAVYLSLLPRWPANGRVIVDILRDTFTSGPFVGFFSALVIGGGIVCLRLRWPRIGFGAEALGLFFGFCVKLALGLNGIEIHRLIRVFIGNHISTADALSAAVIIIFSMNFLWFCGLHGSAIIGSFITGVYAQLAYINMHAAAVGKPIPHLVTMPFLNYVFIGGAGATVILPWLMSFSRSKRIRILGKASILPVLVNVNESLIYLLPLVFNTYFAIPFLISPVFTTVTTYLAVKWGWMPGFSYYIPGVYYLPSPLMAVVTTTPGFFPPKSVEDLRILFHMSLASGSWRSGVISLLQIGALSLFYYPFYKAYEKSVILEEQKAEYLAVMAKTPPES